MNVCVPSKCRLHAICRLGFAVPVPVAVQSQTQPLDHNHMVTALETAGRSVRLTLYNFITITLSSEQSNNRVMSPITYHVGA